MVMVIIKMTSTTTMVLMATKGLLSIMVPTAIMVRMVPKAMATMMNREFLSDYSRQLEHILTLY